MTSLSLQSVRAIVYFHYPSLVIVGFSYPDDFPNTRVHEVYGTLLSNDSIVEIDEEHFRNLTSPMERPTRTKEEAVKNLIQTRKSSLILGL